MPSGHTDYFELKLVGKEPVQKGHFDLRVLPLKMGNKSPMWKVSSLGDRRHPSQQTWGIQDQEGCAKKTCYFLTNLLPQAQISLFCQGCTNLLFLCLRGIKTSYFGDFFEFHISMYIWDPHIYKIKFAFLLLIYHRFPGGAGGKEPTCQCRRQKRRRFDSWVGTIPWRRKWQPTPVFFPEKSHGQRNLVGYNSWGHK